MSVSGGRTKESVIIGMNVFTERPLVSRKCVEALVKVVKEMNTRSFSELEVDTIISRILHVFQARDVYLKLFCYSFIRCAANLSSGAFIAINALVNSITSKKDGIRAESLKLLLQITPDQMLGDYSMHIHQSLIETEYKSLNLVVPVLLFVTNPSLSEWFSNSAWMSGLNTSGAFGNAVILMSRIRPQDGQEIIKTITSSYLKGYSSVISVRYLVNHLSTNKNALKKFGQFFRLEETDDCTFIEAIRSISKIIDVDCSKFVDHAMKGLKTLLSSNSVVTQVATLRTIEGLSNTQYKAKLAAIRPDIEEMLSKGSTVALLAMSILLKIGTDKMAENISKQLPKLLSEMGESQKLSIIDSIGNLCERFTTASWVDVLKSSLDTSGSCEYKVKVIQTISKILKNTSNETLKKEMEKLLYTYIEDSPFPRVTVEILGVLLGKKTMQYKMFLMNRMILDNENVYPAIELALAAEQRTPSHLALLFKEDTPVNECILDSASEILVDVKEMLGDDSKLFESAQKKVSVIESKYNSNELSCSKKIILNRTESEFIISVVKHVFKEFVVLEYTVTSKIDFVLEEGKINVFAEDTSIGEQTVYLRGRESTEVHFRVEFKDFEDICHKIISTSFGYSVNDNRDYEVGEVRLNPFEISPADFIMPTEEEESFAPEHTETKEFKFAMPRSAVLSELKKIFDMPVVEEDQGQFTCKGVFIFTDDLVCVRATVKESGSKSKAQISICSGNEQIRSLLMKSIA